MDSLAGGLKEAGNGHGPICSERRCLGSISVGSGRGYEKEGEYKVRQEMKLAARPAHRRPAGQWGQLREVTVLGQTRRKKVHPWDSAEGDINKAVYETWPHDPHIVRRKRKWAKLSKMLATLRNAQPKVGWLLQQILRIWINWQFDFLHELTWTMGRKTNNLGCISQIVFCLNKIKIGVKMFNNM